MTTNSKKVVIDRLTMIINAPNASWDDVTTDSTSTPAVYSFVPLLQKHPKTPTLALGVAFIKACRKRVVESNPEATSIEDQAKQISKQFFRALIGAAESSAYHVPLSYFIQTV